MSLWGCCPHCCLMVRMLSVCCVSNSIQLSKAQRPSWVLDGLKVKALAGPPDSVSSAFLSFATEDEHLGGVWRPLYPPFKSK